MTCIWQKRQKQQSQQQQQQLQHQKKNINLLKHGK